LPKPNDEHDRWPSREVLSNRADRTAPARAPAVGIVDLDISWLVPADLNAIDVLARLQLAASRRGRLLQLHGAAGGLIELLDFVGLSDVVHLCPCCPRACRPTLPSDADPPPT
jgi:ABC-type transporter Mla MlaB component